MRRLFLAITVVGLIVCVAVYFRRNNIAATNQTPSTVLADSAPTASRSGTAVGCLGRIEPLDGVLQVPGGYLDGRPQRVRELKVQDGDQVRAGQLLAVLIQDQLETALHLAEARVQLARARLAQVKAGARESDIAAQKAQVSEARAALGNARAEYQRFQTLHEQTDVSTAELDARRLAVETSEQKLQQAEQRLKSVSEVRPTDVEIAESELRVANAEVAHARAQLRSAMVYAPANGRVLKIHAYPGLSRGRTACLISARPT